MKYIYISIVCIVMNVVGVYTYSQWEPSPGQESMIAVVQNSFMARQDQWNIEKSQQVHEKLDTIYSKYLRSPLAVWFVTEIRKTLVELDNANGIIAQEATPLVTNTPVVIAEAEQKSVVQELIVRENELGFLRVRLSPSTLSDELGKLNVGERREVLETQDNRHQINYNGEKGWVAGWYVDVEQKQAVEDTIIQEQSNDSLVIMDGSTASADDIYTTYTIDQFVDRRYPEVHEWSKEELSDVNTCLVHYDAVDTVAREMDFPTALVIATRYREFNCRMENPANTRGPFQVTSSYKEPGPITVDQLLVEVREFIEFSRGKHDYYTKLWKFDEIPVKLTHDTVDLVSLQKHSILYNGMYTGVTPANSSYANQNFRTGDTHTRDGIVTMFLKVEKARR